MIKNLPVSAGDTRDAGSLPGTEGSPEVGNDNTLQYSCLEHSMGRRASWATVHRVTKGWPRLSTRDFDFWVRKIPGRGHGNPFQYSCLENAMGRRAWWATVHRVAQSRTRLKRLSTHTIITHDFTFLKSISRCKVVFWVV